LTLPSYEITYFDTAPSKAVINWDKFIITMVNLKKTTYALLRKKPPNIMSGMMAGAARERAMVIVGLTHDIM
jgi:hypothetical protein